MGWHAPYLYSGLPRHNICLKMMHEYSYCVDILLVLVQTNQSLVRWLSTILILFYTHAPTHARVCMYVYPDWDYFVAKYHFHPVLQTHTLTRSHTHMSGLGLFGRSHYFWIAYLRNHFREIKLGKKYCVYEFCFFICFPFLSIYFG